MSSVFWVLMPKRMGNDWLWAFVGTRTTKASALKLASKEMTSNKWGDGLSRVYEAKYDSAGNWVDTIEYSVSRTGSVKMQRAVDGYYSKKDAFIHKLRRQYGVTDDGRLFKRDIEPSMYSLIRML